VKRGKKGERPSSEQIKKKDFRLQRRNKTGYHMFGWERGKRGGARRGGVRDNDAKGGPPRSHREKGKGVSPMELFPYMERARRNITNPLKERGEKKRNSTSLVEKA